MKTILLSICLIFCCQYSFAQLNTYPAKIDTSCSPSLFDMELDGLITGGPALVHWVRTIVFMTKGWTNYICTDQNCFPNDVSTGDFSLKAGNSALLFVHFNPNNIEGCATVNFTISDNNDPNNTFTSVYNMCTWATATGDLKSKQSIQVFPNPTSDFFSINNKQNISSIKVSWKNS